MMKGKKENVTHIKGESKEFDKVFATWMNTSDGRVFSMYILEQLVQEIEVDWKGRPVRVQVGADAPLQLDVE